MTITQNNMFVFQASNTITHVRQKKWRLMYVTDVYCSKRVLSYSYPLYYERYCIK